MPVKRSRASRIRIIPMRRNPRRPSHRLAFNVITGNERKASARGTIARNQYLCAIEKNQSGKYDVRIRAVFRQDGWTIPVYFLASTFTVAMKKLEESIRSLQKSEDRLRFWGLERTDDPNLAGDLLKEMGLALDRRKDLPRKIAEVSVAPARSITSSMVASVRRLLAESLAQERFTNQNSTAAR
jgi:hypothetical protein